MALSPSAAACSTVAITQPYQCKSSKQTSLSPSLNGPISLNSIGSNPTHLAGQSPSQPTTNGTLFYRSLSDFHRLYNSGTTSRLSAEKFNSTGGGPNLPSASSSVRPTTAAVIDQKMVGSRTSMARFLDHIDASSSVLHTGNGQSHHHQQQQRPIESSPTLAIPTVASHSSRRGATAAAITWSQKRIPTSERQQQQAIASATDSMIFEDEYDGHGAPRVVVRHSGECPRQLSQQRVCSVHSPTTVDTTASAASSLLRSSRSFTTSYRQRPNVTRKCFLSFLPFIRLPSVPSTTSGRVTSPTGFQILRIKQIILDQRDM